MESGLEGTGPITTPCGLFFTATVFLLLTPWTADDTLLTNDSNCVWQLLALAWILYINPESLVDGVEAVVGCSTTIGVRLLGALGEWTGVFGGIGASPLEIRWGEQDLLFSSWNDTAIGRISGWTKTNILFSFNSKWRCSGSQQPNRNPVVSRLENSRLVP